MNRPHTGQKTVRVLRIQCQFGCPGAFVYKKDVFPGDSPICCFKDTPLLLGPIGMPQGSNIDDLRIGGVNNNTPDSTRLLQPHMFPGLASVIGFVNPVAHGVRGPYHKGLPGPGPHDVRIGWGNGHSPYGRGLHTVENRLPVDPSVGCFPQPA